MFPLTGPLLSIALGDALGMGHEFNTSHTAESIRNLTYMPSKHPSHIPGNVTDDTTMSRVNAEVVLAMFTTGFRPSVLDFANAYLHNHRKLDPRKGYSRGFQSLLDDPTVQSGADMMSRINANGKKESNGGAMRATPFGLLPGIGQVISLAKRQAECTHTGNGLLAAQAAALMAHHAVYRLGPKAELPAFLASNLSRWHPEFNRPWHGYVANHGLQTVIAALTAIQQTDTLADMLRLILTWGGDTDSVAAIAMGTAWARTEMAHNLPAHLFDQLEDTRFTKGYLMALDNVLLAHARAHGALQ